MVIKKQHARLLLKLGDKWKEGVGLDKVLDKLTNEDLEYLDHLYLAGLIDEEDDEFILTYSGDLVLDVLKNLVDSEVLSHPEEWDESFRWIGSEVIAMIEVGLCNKGEVGDNIKKSLEKRGFVTSDGLLSPYASSIWEAYHEADVKLRINSYIGEYLKKMPPGPGLVKFLPRAKNELLVLESMRLLAYSVPESDVYTLTGLGQQIRAALITGTPFGEVYLNEEMLDVIMGINEENVLRDENLLERMQALGYIDSSHKLLPAGRHLLSAARIYFEGPITTNPSVHISPEEFFVLTKINELGSEQGVDIKVIEKELKKEYPSYDVYEAIYALESYRLIKPVSGEGGALLYGLTAKGKKMIEVAGNKPHEIRSLGVKSITMSRMEYSAPDTRWLKASEDSGLVGKAYPTRKGRFFAELASRPVRYPYISGEMRDILHLIPYEKGISLKKIAALSGKTEEEVLYILERLDAQGVVDALPDNVFTLTEIGRYIKRAVRVVPDGTKHVLTPELARIMLALWEVSDDAANIKVAENLKKVEKTLDLPEEIIEREILLGKRNRFLNDRKILEPGRVLLDALGLYEEIRDIWEEVLV